MLGVILLGLTLGRVFVPHLSAASAQPSDRSAPAIAPLVDGLTFGSQAILELLWPAHAMPAGLHNLPGGRGPVPPLRLLPTQFAPPLAPAWHYSIRRVEPFDARRLVALTFDLCEAAGSVSGYDAPIIDYLRTAHVRATFFAGGKWMRSHPEQTMQLMADPLFEVGNHSWTHGNLRVLQGQEMAQQILWPQAQYELLWEELATRAQHQGIPAQEMAHIPREPLTFRFPYGACSPEALHTLAEYGLPAVQWDVVSGDPAPQQTAQGIVHTVLSQTRPGSIVVFHANGYGHGTAAALPRIIPTLRQRGFEFVTVSELLRLGKVIATEECYELRPGDNQRYDARSAHGARAWH
jgi:peptidoglycan/xylan/chitin deacetylase (PgdA/CDA1 family)